MSHLSATIGSKGAISYRVHSWLAKYGYQKARPVKTRVAGLTFPVKLRIGESSDLSVLSQLVVHGMFEPMRGLESIKTIVDCGANAGFSSAWFLSAYPGSRVIAVEPDHWNAMLCRQNLAPYGDRAQVIEAAVWNHSGSITLLPGNDHDVREWARMVREKDETRPNEVLVEAITIQDLIARAGGQVDLLKIDIEWAERQVFAEPAEWLRNVRHLAIELHDEECRRIFFSSVAGFKYDLSSAADVTLCRNLQKR